MAQQPAPTHAPYAPATYDVADAYAVRAIVNGEATADQQRRAMAWIIQQAAGAYELSYRPESDRDTAFAEGRRFVGLQLIKLLNLPGSVLDAMRKGPDRGNPSEQR